MSGRISPRRRWFISRDIERKQVSLTHSDGRGGSEHLGHVDWSVPDMIVADWIIEHGRPASGDEIILSNTDTLRWTGERLALISAVLPDGLRVFADAKVSA